MASGKPVQKKAAEETFGRVWRLSASASFQKVEGWFSCKLQNSRGLDKSAQRGSLDVWGTVILLQKWELGMT